MDKIIEQTLTHIAQKYLFIDTLETQNSDRLDFHNVSVWGIESALLAAYKAGQNHKIK